MNCWEFMKCGRERGGRHAGALGVCPAYPHHGTDCARVVGTLCKGRVQEEFAVKIRDCQGCAFYRSEHYARIAFPED